MDDKANGYGIYKHVNGAKYEGNWKDDLQDGFGVESWGDGSKYEGYYKEGKKHGEGSHLLIFIFFPKFLVFSIGGAFFNFIFVECFGVIFWISAFLKISKRLEGFFKFLEISKKFGLILFKFFLNGSFRKIFLIVISVSFI